MFGLLKIFFKFYNRFFSPDKLFAKRLRSLVGFTPSNIGIFKLAFYHKSASSEKLYAVQSNERLEYLGDAVLGTIVAEYLFKKYPQKDEGFLTKMRSKIVKRQSLNKIADKMGLDVFLNQYNNTRLSRSMLGNALEALVGAVYIERGYNQTRQYVIQKILRGYLDIHELESFDDNYKSQLLEWCQKNGQTVSYKMLAKYKFEKRDRFKVAVLIDGKKLASADDFNKKSAEQTASEKAMQILGLLKEDKEEGGDKRKSRHNARNPRSSKSRAREDKNPNRRDNRNNDSRNKKNNDSKSRKPQPRKKDQQIAKSSTVAKKEDSDWSDVKLDIPESTSKVAKSAGSGSKNSRPSRSNRSNSSKKKTDNTDKRQDNNQGKRDNKPENQASEKKENTGKGRGRSQAKEGNKPEGKTSEKSNNPKQENKKKPAPRKPRAEVTKKVENQGNTESPQQKKVEKEKAPRIVKKRIEKAPKEVLVNKKDHPKERVSDKVDAIEPVKVEVAETKPKAKTKNSPRRNNPRRSRGNSSAENRNTQSIDTEESVEIEIPVNLTQDIVEKVKPRQSNKSTDSGENPPVV